MAASTYMGMERDLHISQEVAVLSVSLFVAGLGVGPLLLGPLSEFLGRNKVSRTFHGLCTVHRAQSQAEGLDDEQAEGSTS